MSTLQADRDLDLEQKIRELGEALWAKAQGEVPSLFDKSYWQGRMMEWAMRDPEFKLDLFRFVDVLPVLQNRAQVTQHVREYLLKGDRRLPGVVNLALNAAWGNLASGLASRTIRNNVADMARRFIVGRDPKEAIHALKEMDSNGLAFTVDLLGEATVSDAEADVYRTRYIDLIESVSESVSEWPENDIVCRNHLGPIPRANISLKVSALSAHLDPVDRPGAVRHLVDQVLPLLLLARERNVFVNLDLEQWELHGITYDLFEEVVSHHGLRDWPHLGVVVQAYLKSAPQDVDRLRSIARSRGTPLTVRLVKGAYWDFEVVRARQHGYPCPVFTDKATTDAQFEQLSGVLLENVSHLFPAFGSHNLRSLSHALTLAKARRVPERAFEVQMLYGMAEPERNAIRDLGYRVRIYSPIGELLPGIAYLVRRLLENTSNEGFLRLKHHEDREIHDLLEPPKPRTADVAPSDKKRGDLTPPFENCPLADFADPEVCDRFAREINAIPASLPLEIPTVVAGEAAFSKARIEQVCPSEAERLITRVSLSTKQDVVHAIEASVNAWPSWRDRPIESRVELLDRLGDRLEADRFELAALQTFEEGKPWREADGDVAEAVDFCRYYARQALIELTPRRQGDMWGERNLLSYQGRGPTAVIAPWNFPLAILCGMTTAALVAGNPVLMKPAGQSSGVAYAFYTRMIEVGIPDGIVHFLPGSGGEIGAYMVGHPGVAQIAFTGSKEVGLSIIARAGQTQPGQPQVKRVVCEMGGKNAIIVDDDADLDEAVAGVMQSAFGYAGQKCSACSRVVVVGTAYEPFVRRLVEACRSLVIGPAHDPLCELGPVIGEDAYYRLKEVILNVGKSARLLYVGEAPSGGYFVAPALFEVEDPKHRLMQEELFGPILALMKVSDFEEALDAAMTSEFALTGGVYSRCPSHLAAAEKRFRVGNLYLNRGCTGAVVHRQPFGGFGMSGVGTKAGGPGYLLNFAEPRAVSENTTRRGFTPDMEG